ncbi:patatin-like phospholipase family protein [Brevundimonas sp. DS20]|uniref:patatin-like phospholipase family protein n=1 Tax=Brevundimonas sp. DS20 TaxID=1532555 RepID=UPI0009EA2A0B|nr:patatin-like phospholipase family protein [Brevundimonas sp. DS20]
MAIFKRKTAEPTDLAAASTGRRPFCLALQGGGAHGAFQWGVLDRLLEDDRLDIRAVSGVSAGAMNGAALISGLASGDARAALDRLWREINQSGGRNVFGDSALWNPAQAPDWLKDTPLWRAGETLALSMSPYEFNPLNHNPLKRVLKTAVDFQAVQGSDVKLFVAATAVRQARARIFASSEITADVLMASACLPHLFQAVEIEGEPYWDGGYLTNPPLWPLTGDDTPDDVLLVTLNPMVRDETPRAAGDIVDRLNEILFNAPLLAELRAIAMAGEMISQGQLKHGSGPYRQLRLHAIEADGWLSDLSLRSKFNTEWSFLTDLKARGRAAADDWLETCLASVGRRSSVDLQARFG